MPHSREALPHENPNAFAQSLAATAASTGFSQRFIEKDYFCSLVLQNFTPLFPVGLVFKGGTALSKVHLDFFRLSEDLDFCISTPNGMPRSKRRETIAPIKAHVASIASRCPYFSAEQSEGLIGHREGTQYSGTIAYASQVTGIRESIKIEVSLREPILMPVFSAQAATLLRDPFNGKPLLATIAVATLTREETYAEKLRAALTRQEVAIRDYFDIFYAWQAEAVSFRDPAFLALFREKLALSDYQGEGISSLMKEELERQSKRDLPGLVRARDCDAFDLNAVIGEILRILA